MIDSIVRLEPKFEVARLIASMSEIVPIVGWSRNNQIALTIDDGEWERGTPFLVTSHGNATKPSREDGEIVRHDSDFKRFIMEFRATYFYHVWETMMEETDGRVCRMRLMKLDHKGCLSFHEDFCIRYHIPIVTNPRAFFWMNESGQFPIPTDDIRLGALTAYHLPADGSVFKVDTTRHHTVYNGGREPRIHLVMSDG